jgi:hypothetical protein
VNDLDGGTDCSTRHAGGMQVRVKCGREPKCVQVLRKQMIREIAKADPGCVTHRNGNGLVLGRVE